MSNLVDDALALGRKWVSKASRLGSKLIGGVRQGIKYGDRALNSLGSGVETIASIPYVGSALKPFTAPVRAGIQAGRKV